MTLVGERLQMPQSLWADTAIKAPSLKALSGNVSCDVAIVGSGFTGLSTAIHLAELGLDCVVVDAAEPGWGASGRNNGQVIAGLKQDPDVVEKIWPGAMGEKLVRFGSQAPGKVFDLIQKHSINCAGINRGWIQPAYTRSGDAAVRHRCEAWRARGIDARLLEGQKLFDLLGTRKYHIGWIDPRGGSIQPLSYARGLAHTALRLGVRIHNRTSVQSITGSAGNFVLKTASGSVFTKSVIVATGAYAENLVPGLRTSFVPVRTAQVATQVLPLDVRSAILPKGNVASDTRQLLTSFRLSPDGRLVMGGSGATAGLDHSRIVPYLHRAGQELFSHLGKIEWSYAWSGYFAVTTDHLPHVHEPRSGLHIAVGCNGRGIAISTSMGIELANRVAGAQASDLSIPVTSLRNVAFHRFRALGVAAATQYKRMQDRLG
ncbi:FAD-dependent oxidoreductase [Paraburkholderia madseniana]|uniref:FAD-dependent oxidoreductase n=2 Tax=Paraburkholderia madseniana TaxID=2599607 RepID=A0A6N6W5E0_9BURK|nr:FAD-dependent oxidoreductase [Paraburkholderia madseniana]